MNAQTHTPGPWTAHQSNIYAPDGAIIAQVQNPGAKEADYPLVANRDLMAAAPDLFGALKFILAFYEPGQTYLDTEAWKHAEGSARAAIAKARGQA